MMALQSITNINIDFYNKRHILINAKQLDKGSRFLSVTCYDHGDIFLISAAKHSAYVRYKKPDGHSVFNVCDINYQGKILIELTEQMLAVDGICYVDLVVVNKGDASIDSDTGEIVTIDNAAILSTMTFCIDVSEIAVANSEIESSYEYNGLNEALEKAEAEYTKVIQLAKSYAIGETNSRENEDSDNAKYYYEQSLSNASSAKTSENNAAASAANASLSEANAKTSETNAAVSEANAKDSDTNARQSRDEARQYAEDAAQSETAAMQHATDAMQAMETVENINNNITDSINTLAANGSIGSFIFMGTITFTELMALSDDRKATGYVYCVSDDFTTNDSFVNGTGLLYTAGTNVYFCSDGLWDCLSGTTPPTATVDEVKEYLCIE